MSSVRPNGDVLRHGAAGVMIAGRRFRFRIVVDARGAVVACLPEGPDVMPRVARSCRIATWIEDAAAVAPAADALRRCAAGGSVETSLELAPVGTPFQRRVWDALRAIPADEDRTYGHIARDVGRPGAARAVGQACRANPVLVLIPCHRVVGRDGVPRGYAGGSELLVSLRRAARLRYSGGA